MHEPADRPHGEPAAAGAATFLVPGDAYDRFMGRYSQPLSRLFADAAGVTEGQTALDVGCGPGALTGELVSRLGAAAVCGLDPSPVFVAECARRHPGVDVRAGRSEQIPFDAGRFDRVLCQLVLHFVTDGRAAVSEMRRVTAPGGTVAACVWDFSEGMEMLRLFWDAALAIEPAAPDEARTLRFARQGDIAELFTGAGIGEIHESMLRVESAYRDFDELWAGYLEGIGPAGAFCAGLTEDRRELLRRELHARLGSPAGRFTLQATARCVTGRVP